MTDSSLAAYYANCAAVSLSLHYAAVHCLHKQKLDPRCSACRAWSGKKVLIWNLLQCLSLLPFPSTPLACLPGLSSLSPFFPIPFSFPLRFVGSFTEKYSDDSNKVTWELWACFDLVELCSTVDRTSVLAGELTLSCTRPIPGQVTTLWVNCPL